MESLPFIDEILQKLACEIQKGEQWIFGEEMETLGFRRREVDLHLKYDMVPSKPFPARQRERKNKL